MTKLVPSSEMVQTDMPIGSILVIDDTKANRLVLENWLQKQGYDVTLASDGATGLRLARSRKFDLILLDIVMPEMDGFEVLRQLKSDVELRTLPVVAISALEDLDSVIRAIELGAEDFLVKPLEWTLLRARVEASLDKKRLRDRERDYLDQIQAQRLESDRLLLNILPKQIAERLKKGERTIADHFPDATVMFSDINDFTSLAARVRPDELVSMLSEVFYAFDVLADQYAMEKVKTVGDAYMAVAGVPQPRSDHANALARMALEMHETISEMRAPDGRRIHMRSGVHSGPVVGGVIGRTKFSYDLWGDTVNIAAKLRGIAPADTVLVSESTYERLRDSFTFGQAGQVSLKGRRRIATYYLLR